MTTSLGMLDEDEKIRVIKDAINSANASTDLVPIMQKLSLSAIKDFVNQQIEHETAHTISSIYYDALSLDSLLTDDVQQNILAFDGLYHSKRVCKKWKLLSDKNETNYLNQVYSDCPAPTIHAKSTLIIHPNRTRPHPIEIKRGFKGPMRFQKAAELFKMQPDFADTLLFHEGTHRVGTSELAFKSGFQSGADINLIGLGRNVSISFRGKLNNYTCLWNPLIHIGRGCHGLSINIRNISFATKKYYRRVDTIFCQGDGNLITIKDCRFSKSGVDCLSSSDWQIENCIFVDTPRSFSKGREYETASGNVHITGSMFKRCGAIHDDDSISHCIIFDGSNGQGTLICDNNVFEDNPTHPIVDEEWGADSTYYVRVNGRRHYQANKHFIGHKGQHVLKDNVLRGNNDFEGQTFDANKIYKVI